MRRRPAVAALRALTRSLPMDPGDRRHEMGLSQCRDTSILGKGREIRQGAHRAPRRERRGAQGSPQADAGGLGRSPIKMKPSPV